MGGTYAQSSASPVSVSASKGSGKGTAAGKLTSFTIDIAEQGYVGRVRYTGKPSKDGYPMYTPEKEYALADRAAVHSFVASLIGSDKAAKK